jgi:hypothetical protein
MKLRVGASARHVGWSRAVIGPGDEVNLLTRESEVRSTDTESSLASLGYTRLH